MLKSCDLHVNSFTSAYFMYLISLNKTGKYRKSFEGTRAMLNYGLVYKNTSFLHHSIHSLDVIMSMSVISSHSVAISVHF